MYLRSRSTDLYIFKYLGCDIAVCRIRKDTAVATICIRAWFIYIYRVLYIIYSRSLVPDVLNLVSTSTARITAVCSRKPRRTENDILRLWLRRLRVDPNRKTELKILKVAPSSYHKYRGTKKFVPGYRESDELLVRIGAYSEVPRGSHGVVRNLL